jgi:hypothetical protein
VLSEGIYDFGIFYFLVMAQRPPQSTGGAGCPKITGARRTLSAAEAHVGKCKKTIS